MNTRLNKSFFTAGAALILLTGCVSSRKYKASQADLAKVRNDSAQLAQQLNSANGNVKDLQDKNSALQQQLTTANNNYSNQQKSLDYYQGYFKDQEQNIAQVSDDVKGALSQAGLSNADVQQMNNTVYVRLDENELFRKNSTAETPGGKKALNGLADVIKNRTNVNVFVAAGDSAVAGGATAGNMSGMYNNGSGMSSDENPRPRHHRSHHAASSARSGSGQGNGGSSSGGSVAANSASSGSNGGKTTTPVHHRVHHHYSPEGSMAIYNGPGMHNHSWALKQRRMVMVADSFLKNGVAKINVSMQQPPMNGNPDNTIRVIITPKMEDFNPPTNASATR